MTYDKVLGYRFGVPSECADPDQIYDWLVAHPNEWVRVFSLEEYLPFPSRKRAVQGAGT